MKSLLCASDRACPTRLCSCGLTDTHLQPLPTWKETPITARPRLLATLSSLGASAGSHPYFRPRGQRACVSRRHQRRNVMRQTNQEPPQKRFSKCKSHARQVAALHTGCCQCWQTIAACLPHESMTRPPRLLLLLPMCAAHVYCCCMMLHNDAHLWVVAAHTQHQLDAGVLVCYLAQLALCVKGGHLQA